MQHDFSKKYCSQCCRSRYVLMPENRHGFKTGQTVLLCYGLKRVTFIHRNATYAGTCTFFKPHHTPKNTKIYTKEPGTFV